jgi:crotonobetainyl-CoA:carnitine CoA-transferase CaiB-like acyl-CoA transferase
MTQRPQPLDGIVVTDLTQVVLGPSATQVLGDFGADVIKVERIGRGDLQRSTLPDDPEPADNPVFASLNRNKRSIAVDLRDPDGVELVVDLVRRSDVMVNNFRPDVLDRLGLSWERLRQVNPRLIFAVGTGYGTSGPYRRKGGQDMLLQAMSGAMERRSDPGAAPAIFPTTIADYGASMHLVQGILLALLVRERTGRGQFLEVSLYDTMLAMQLQEATHWLMRGEELNWADMPHTGVFGTSDGWVVIVGAFRDDPIGDIGASLGIDGLSLRPEYASLELARMNKTELHAEIAVATAKLTTSEAVARLEEADILCAPVRSLGDALVDEQTDANGMLLTCERTGRTPLRTVGSPVHLGDGAAALHLPPPSLGEHTDEVLSQLGYERSRIDALRRAGVVG